MKVKKYNRLCEGTQIVSKVKVTAYVSNFMQIVPPPFTTTLVRERIDVLTPLEALRLMPEIFHAMMKEEDKYLKGKGYENDVISDATVSSIVNKKGQRFDYEIRRVSEIDRRSSKLKEWRVSVISETKISQSSSDRDYFIIEELSRKTN